MAYGAEHQYMLESLLGHFPGAISKKMGDRLILKKINIKTKKLPQDLVNVFKKDLSLLEKYAESLKPGSEERGELESKRIPGLKKVIEQMAK